MHVQVRNRVVQCSRVSGYVGELPGIELARTRLEAHVKSVALAAKAHKAVPLECTEHLMSSGVVVMEGIYDVSPRVLVPRVSAEKALYVFGITWYRVGVVQQRQARVVGKDAIVVERVRINPVHRKADALCLEQTQGVASRREAEVARVTGASR